MIALRKRRAILTANSFTSVATVTVGLAEVTLPRPTCRISIQSYSRSLRTGYTLAGEGWRQ